MNGTRVGKAYSTEEKADLIPGSKDRANSRRRFIWGPCLRYMPGCQKEVRTMQWNRMNLDKMHRDGRREQDGGTLAKHKAADALFSKPKTKDGSIPREDSGSVPTRSPTSHHNSVTGGICKSMKNFGSSGRIRSNKGIDRIGSY
jgi:hypothetical protein